MTTVGELMSTAPFTIRCNDAVGDTRDALLSSGIHCVPVVDDEGTPVGIVTSWDLVEEYGPLEAVRNVMTSRVQTIGGHQHVSEAATAMRTNAIHHLVVVDESKHVIGVLSSLDLLELLSNEGEILTPWQ